MNASGGCGLVRFMECVELMYGSRFHLGLKWAVYVCSIGPEILYGCEAWCLNESEMGILQKTE